jgi:hypothetical protein
MKQIIRNIEEWLTDQSFATAEPRFQYEGSICTPVIPVDSVDGGPRPVGFLVNHDYEVSFVSPSPATPGHNLQWESMVMTYLIRKTELEPAGPQLPSEYWYG